MMAASFRAATVAALTVSVLLIPIPTDAQAPKTYRVGHVTNVTGEQNAYLDTFRAALRDLGYVEGINLKLDLRAPDREMTQVPALVDELILLKPDVLVGWEAIAQVMRIKTSTIPIVLTGAVDPVRAGLAQSLRRPGMNVTGSAQLFDSLPGKHIATMREIHPRLSRVGQLVDVTASGCKAVEESSRQAAQSIGARFISYDVANRADLDRAFLEMQKERPDVLLPCPSFLLFNYRDVLFENALRLRIPLTSFVVANVPDGVLFAYATSLHETYRSAAIYIDKILKGAKPADLPIEQPTKFDLVVNLRTAKALGLTIPQSLLVRADRVIQ
jgi:putative ABC transport system substrate-binding protein